MAIFCTAKLAAFVSSRLYNYGFNYYHLAIIVGPRHSIHAVLYRGYFHADVIFAFFVVIGSAKKFGHENLTRIHVSAVQQTVVSVEHVAAAVAIIQRLGESIPFLSSACCVGA